MHIAINIEALMLSDGDRKHVEPVVIPLPTIPKGSLLNDPAQCAATCDCVKIS